VGTGFAIQLFGMLFAPVRTLLGLTRLGPADFTLSLLNAGLSFALIDWQTAIVHARRLPAGSRGGTGSLQAA
jgi:hypothetical protein